jgi:hypothetical protein
MRRNTPMRRSEPRQTIGAGLRGALPLALSATALLALAGCGSHHHNQADLNLEREDLVAVAHALQRARPAVESELAASTRAWPLVVNGLPTNARGLAGGRETIAQAALSAARLPEPGPMTETESRYLTGPGAPLASIYRQYTGLVGHGWTQIAAMSAQLEHGGPAAKRFARENVALYIESVYDGQFDLGQIQKRLKKGYDEVGGQQALGSRLTQAEVSALEALYSEARTRLSPRATVKLGS